MKLAKPALHIMSLIIEVQDRIVIERGGRKDAIISLMVRNENFRYRYQVISTGPEPANPADPSIW